MPPKKKEFKRPPKTGDINVKVDAPVSAESITGQFKFTPKKVTAPSVDAGSLLQSRLSQKATSLYTPSLYKINSVPVKKGQQMAEEMLQEQEKKRSLAGKAWKSYRDTLFEGSMSLNRGFGSMTSMLGSAASFVGNYGAEKAKQMGSKGPGLWSVYTKVGDFFQDKGSKTTEALKTDRSRAFDEMFAEDQTGALTKKPIEFFLTKVPEQLPPTIPFLLLGGGTTGVVAQANFLAKSSVFTKAVVSSLAGSAVSRPLESLSEAGETYNAAIAKGMSEKDAVKAGAQVFTDNMKLVGLDAFQLALAFTPIGKVLTGAKTIIAKIVAEVIESTLGGFSEGGEEVYQAYIQKKALGEDFDIWGNESQQSFILGVVGGVIFQAAGKVLSPKEKEEAEKDYTEKIIEKLPAEMKPDLPADASLSDVVNELEKIAATNPDLITQAASEINNEYQSDIEQAKIAGNEEINKEETITSQVPPDIMTDINAALARVRGETTKTTEPQPITEPQGTEGVFENIPEDMIEEATEAWEDTYADSYAELESQVQDINKQLKTAKAAEKKALQAQQDELVKQQVEQEQTFIREQQEKIKEKTQERIKKAVNEVQKSVEKKDTVDRTTLPKSLQNDLDRYERLDKSMEDINTDDLLRLINVSLNERGMEFKWEGQYPNRTIVVRQKQSRFSPLGKEVRITGESTTGTVTEYFLPEGGVKGRDELVNIQMPNGGTRVNVPASRIEPFAKTPESGTVEGNEKLPDRDTREPIRQAADTVRDRDGGEQSRERGSADQVDRGDVARREDRSGDTSARERSERDVEAEIISYFTGSGPIGDAFKNLYNKRVHLKLFFDGQWKNAIATMLPMDPTDADIQVYNEYVNASDEVKNRIFNQLLEYYNRKDALETPISAEIKPEIDLGTEKVVYTDAGIVSTTRTTPIAEKQNTKIGKVIVDIIKSKEQDLRDESLFLTAHAEGFMPLTIERLPTNELAVSHTFTQNGDLMRDPEVVFLIDKDGQLQAQTIENPPMVLNGVELIGPRPISPRDSFLNLWADNIRSQGFVPKTKKPVKVDPGKVNREQIKKLEADMRAIYLGVGDSDIEGFAKADEVMSQIITELELAEPGDRIISPDGVISYPSTFPAWIPEASRNRDDLNALIEMFRDVRGLSYPSKTVETKRREFADAFFDELDFALKVNTKPLREQILKLYDIDSTINQGQEVSEVSQNSAPRSAEGATSERTSEGYTNEEIENIIKDYAYLDVANRVQLTNDRTPTKEQLRVVNAWQPAGGREAEGAEGRGLLDEYYTPGEVVEMVRTMLDRAGAFDQYPITVLEPSVGIGNFLYAVPEGSKITAYEINETSARLAKINHPTANIVVQPFEELFVDKRGNKKPIDYQYEIVVGNPPYGSHRGVYKGLGEEGKISRYETYFMKRSLDLTVEGGYMAMVVPSSFLRSSMKEPGKEQMAALGELVEAIRLPNGTFATTDIGTDILLFRKSSTKELATIDNRVRRMSGDAYFLDQANASRILGEKTQKTGRFGVEDAVKGDMESAQKAFAEVYETEEAPIRDAEIVDAPSVTVNDVLTASPEKLETIANEPSPVQEVAQREQARRIEKKAETNLDEQKTMLEKLDLKTGDKVQRFHQGKTQSGTLTKEEGSSVVQVQTEKGELVPVDANWYKQDEVAPLTSSDTLDLATLSPESVKDGQWEYVSATGELEGNFDPKRAFYMGGKYYNAFNYAQGDIYAKLAQLEKDKKTIGEEQYKPQKAMLEAVLPPRMTVDRMRIPPHAHFTEEVKFTVDVAGEKVPKSLQSMFIEWIGKLPMGAFGESSRRSVQQYVFGEAVRGGDKLQNEQDRRTRRIEGDKLFKVFLTEELTAEQKKKVEDEYNRRFNSYSKPDYSLVPLVSKISAMYKGDKLDLREIQRQGIGFLLNKGVGLLAHDVGLGKTMQGIIANIELINRGWAKRPLVVLPSASVYAQWVKDFRALKPDIKINELSNLGKDFKGDFATLTIPDGTISVITEEGFKKLGFSDATYKELTKDMLDVIDNPDDGKKTKRAKELKTAKVGETIGMAMKGTSAERTFEDLGFDAITVDECFVAGTQVLTSTGYKNIEDIQAGEEVVNAIGTFKVSKTHKLFKKDLVRIKLDNGKVLEVTANHPFLTENGWVEAANLTGRTVLQYGYVNAIVKKATQEQLPDVQESVTEGQSPADILQPEVSKPRDVQSSQEEVHRAETNLDENMQSVWDTVRGEITVSSSLIQEVLQSMSHTETTAAYEDKQSHDERSQSPETSTDVEENRPSTASIGRERESDTSTTNITDGARPGLDGGVYSANENEPTVGLSNTLQDRSSTPEENDSRRSGRNVTQFTETEGNRLEETSLLRGVRVESVEVYQSASEEGVAVYNLSVEGHPSYVVEGLVVHNCHNYNHIIGSAKAADNKATEYRGFTQTPSISGLKLWLAAQYIMLKNNGRNVIGLSATPFTNHPLEYYSILSLFARKRMQEMGIRNVNDFMAMFMDVTAKNEVTADGQIASKLAVRGFNNAQQFQALLREFIDFRDGEEAGIKRPNRQSRTFVVKENRLSYDYKQMAQPLFDIKEGGTLMAMTELQTIAFSPYESQFHTGPVPTPKEFVEGSPKIKLATDLLAETYFNVPNSNHIVYSHRGKMALPKIKEYLVKEKGIPADQIELITGDTAKAKRTTIQNDFNAGKIRVIIGNVAIEEGINLQERTTDMYLLSQPWNFTAVRQVIGRAWRQGNKWNDVRINQFFTENTFDIYMSQALEKKRVRYEQSLKQGEDYVDSGDVDYDEMKYLLMTDPVMRTRQMFSEKRQLMEQEIKRIKSDFATRNRRAKEFVDAVAKVNEYKAYIVKYPDASWAKSNLRDAEEKLVRVKQNLTERGIDVASLNNDLLAMEATITDLELGLKNFAADEEEAVAKAKIEAETQVDTVGQEDYAARKNERKDDDKKLFDYQPKFSLVANETEEPMLQAVYHGSPHRYDHPSLDYIGTGEGAQSYGWGYYVTEKEEIAEYYKKTLTEEKNKVWVKGENKIHLREPETILKEYFKVGETVIAYGNSRDKVISLDLDNKRGWEVTVVAVDKDGRQIEGPRTHSTYPSVEYIEKVFAERGWERSKEGYLYEMEVKDEAVETMLLWDETIDKQTPTIQALWDRFAEVAGLSKIGYSAKTFSGSQFYGMLTTITDEITPGQLDEVFGIDTTDIDNEQKAASIALLSAGVRGIKYKTGSTRNKADRADYNYVVFDTNDITVLRRNGEELTKAEKDAMFARREQPRDAIGRFSPVPAEERMRQAYIKANNLLNTRSLDVERAKKDPIYKMRMTAGTVDQASEQIKRFMKQHNVRFTYHAADRLYIKNSSAQSRNKIRKQSEAYGIYFAGRIYLSQGRMPQFTGDHELVHQTMDNLVGKHGAFKDFTKDGLLLRVLAKADQQLYTDADVNNDLPSKEDVRRLTDNFTSLQKLSSLQIRAAEEILAVGYEYEMSAILLKKKSVESKYGPVIAKFYQAFSDLIVELKQFFDSGYADDIVRFYDAVRSGKEEKVTMYINSRPKVHNPLHKVSPEGITYVDFSTYAPQLLREKTLDRMAYFSAVLGENTTGLGSPQLPADFYTNPDKYNEIKKDINELENVTAQARDIFLKDPKYFEVARTVEMVGEAHDADKHQLDNTFADLLKPYMDLKPEQRARVNETLWKGDEEGKRFDEGTLIRMSLSAEQITAYNAVRDALDAAHETLLTEMARKGINENELDTFRQERKGYMPHRWIPRMNPLRKAWSYINKDVIVVKHRRRSEEGGWETYHMDAVASVKEAKERQLYLYKNTPQHELSKVDFKVSKLTSLEVDFFSSLELTSEKMIGVIDSMRDKGFIKDEVQEILKNNLLDMFKEKGFGRHYLRRSGIRGYDTTNTELILADYFSGFAGYVTKMRWSTEYFVALANISDRDQPMFYKWVRDLIAYKLNNNPEWRMARTIAFTWYLANDLSYLITNMTQNVIVGLGELSKHVEGSEKAWKPEAYMIKAVKDWATKNVTAEELAAINGLLEKGELGAEMTVELMGFKNNPLYREISSTFSKVLYGSTAIVEREVNRIPAFLAARRIFREQGLSETTANIKALEVSKDIHFRYGRIDRPRFLRGKVNVLFIFQNYIRTFLYQLYRDASRREFIALTRKMGYTFALGGASALPFAGLFWSILKGIGDDEDDEELKKELTTWDILLQRGIPATFDIDLSTRVGIELLSVTKVLEDPADIRMYMGTVGDLLFKRPLDVMNLIGQQRYMDAWAKALPDVLANPIRAYNGYTYGVRSINGVPLLDNEGDVYKYSTWEAVIKAAGFTPTQEAILWDEKAKEWKRDEAQQEKRIEISRTIRGMVQRGEFEEARQLQDDAKEAGIIAEKTDYIRTFAKDEWFEEAVTTWESGNKTREELDTIEEELIEKVYGGVATDPQRNNVRKELAIYRQFGLKNENVNDIMKAATNADKVKILLEIKDNIGQEAFDTFITNGRTGIYTEAGNRVPILFSDDLMKLLREEERKYDNQN